MLARRVQAEVLDGLAAADPVAERSRRDLQRVHRVIRSRGRLVSMLRALSRPRVRPLRMLELGAGDGTLMLRVARDVAASWPAVELTLLDRVAAIDGATITEFARFGWTARASHVDVLDWARANCDGPAGTVPGWDVIVANLFLHHFEGRELALVLRAVAANGEHFLACEPRRGWRALAGSHLIGALGVNDVTRTDAVLSVHAGFRGRELTAVWPRNPGWRLQECTSGPFVHCFIASRRSAP